LGSASNASSGSSSGSRSSLGSSSGSGDDGGAPLADAPAGDDLTTTSNSAAIDDATVADTATGDDSSNQVMDAWQADDGLAAMCATKLCVDPVFDCILQGCGAAVCQNLYCIIPSE
jgi:hypothetical protein